MWKNVNVNVQNIQAETEKAALIKMPKNSKYEGFAFWHPQKLVHSGRNNNAVSLGYTEDFTFKLKKYGQGKYNRNEVIDEKEINADEFEEAFEVMNENISWKKSNYKKTSTEDVKDEEEIEEDVENDDEEELEEELEEEI